MWKRAKVFGRIFLLCLSEQTGGGKSSESGDRRRRKAERLLAAIAVYVYLHGNVDGADEGAAVVNAAVAANCNVFRDAPQVQLRANFPAQVFPLPHFV